MDSIGMACIRVASLEPMEAERRWVYISWLFESEMTSSSVRFDAHGRPTVASRQKPTLATVMAPTQAQWEAQGGKTIRDKWRDVTRKGESQRRLGHLQTVGKRAATAELPMPI